MNAKKNNESLRSLKSTKTDHRTEKNKERNRALFEEEGGGGGGGEGRDKRRSCFCLEEPREEPNQSIKASILFHTQKRTTPKPNPEGQTQIKIALEF